MWEDALDPSGARTQDAKRTHSAKQNIDMRSMAMCQVVDTTLALH